MKNSVALAKALDKASDEIYSDVQELIFGLPYLDLAPAQLSAMITTAQSSTEVNKVALYVKHQMGRDNRQTEPWRERDNDGLRLGDRIAAFSEKEALARAAAVLSEANEPLEKGPQREIAVELIRRYVTTFGTLYRYAIVERGGANG